MIPSLVSAAIGVVQVFVPPMLAPPAPVRMHAPTSGVVAGRFECGEDWVELDLVTSRSSATVTKYSVNGRAASDAQLAQWNAQLAPISNYNSFVILCSEGDAQVIAVRAVVGPRGSGTSTVFAEWRAGVLHLRTQAPDH